MKGCIFTIDTMGCQNAIATQIRAQGGDHMPGLKDNQGALRMNLFEQEASPTYSSLRSAARPPGTMITVLRSCLVAKLYVFALPWMPLSSRPGAAA